MGFTRARERLICIKGETENVGTGNESFGLRLSIGQSERVKTRVETVVFGSRLEYVAFLRANKGRARFSESQTLAEHRK